MTTRNSPRYSLASLLSSESDLAEFQALSDASAQEASSELACPRYVTTQIRKLSPETLAEIRAVRLANARAEMEAARAKVETVREGLDCAIARKDAHDVREYRNDLMHAQENAHAAEMAVMDILD